jgi:diguanylate cyclase (GGDEF)-like protein/PAS domain S-box-containing protein
MRHEGTHDPEQAGRVQQEVLAEQVRLVYGLAPFGILATVINSLIVFFIMDGVTPNLPLGLWLSALLAVSAIRAALVLRFRRISAGPFDALIWKRAFITGLALVGMVWGSVVFFAMPAATSPAYHVFLAFVLGGMAAGAASSFSVLEEGYPAFTVPALAPLIIRFLTVGDSFYYAMAAMTALYVYLLWRIARHHNRAVRTSLVLRFENREMIDRLRSAKENLEAMYAALRREIDEKLKAENELRAHQEHLERIVEERTADLMLANKDLKAQMEQRLRFEHALTESTERLALAQEAGKVGVFDIDMVSGKAFWSEQLAELFGLQPGDFEKNYDDWKKRILPEDRTAIEAQFLIWMSERREHIEFEYRFTRGDGQVRWMSATARFTYSDDGTPTRMIGTTVDSTERKRLEEEILHMVHHDTLTGLPNRRLFMDIVNLELAQARRTRRKFGLLFLDLDRFKDINDTFGHTAGDELLKEASRRIKGSIRESDAVARIGGDEFNVILSDIARSEDISSVAGKIMDSFKKPFHVSGHTLRITTSIGISIYPDDSDDIQSLFRYADIAMYHAKERGKNAFEFYNPAINILSVERLNFENLLRQTLVRKELAVYYQPQVSVRTGQVVAAEALVRWNHPERGLLESRQFVAAAEDIGFITAIDTWVLRTACAQFSAWINDGHPDLCVAVNLSTRIFQNRDILDMVAGTLRETGLAPDRLEIEITESVAMDDIEHTVTVLKELVNRGIGITIDDFGTGYSSFNYLKRLPIQRLKIDQSFVRDIATDPDDRNIIHAMTAMAHNMRISVVAEGVETGEQLSFLAEAECDEAQGYFLNKPLSAEQFEKLIVANR